VRGTLYVTLDPPTIVAGRALRRPTVERKKATAQLHFPVALDVENITSLFDAYCLGRLMLLHVLAAPGLRWDTKHLRGTRFGVLCDKANRGAVEDIDDAPTEPFAEF
jgi:hypothetical protein